MAVRTEGETTFNDLARRVHVPPADFAAKVYDVVAPGTTIVVTDAPALRTSPSVFLMESAGKQARNAAPTWNLDAIVTSLS